MAIELTRTKNGTTLSKDDRESTVSIPHFNKIEIDISDMTANARDMSEKNLEVMLKMDIDLPVQKNLSLMDNKILKSLKVCVVRTKQKNFSSAIEKSNNLNLQKFIKQEDYEIVYQGLLSNLVDPRKIAMASKSAKNGKILKVHFELKDCPKNIKDHLSYYSACYLETGKDNTQKNNQKISLQRAISGPVSGERVIESGKLNTQSFVYRISSPGKMKGAYWTGPTIETKDGNLMTARWATRSRVQRLIETTPPMELKKTTVRNSTIQDLRISKQAPSLKFDLKPTNETSMIIEGRDTYNNSLKSPNSYTRAFLSRDMDNNCRGLVFFDYYGFLAQKSEFGKILTNNSTPITTKQKIFKNSRITNLKIVRTQLNTRARGYNRLGSETLTDNSVIQSSTDVTIIAETTSEKGSAFLEAAKSIGAPGVGTKADVVGSIQEMSKLKNLQKGNRVFMFTDNSFSTLSNGSWKFGIVAKIEDGTLIFLNERMKRLKTIIEYLRQYLAFQQTTSNVQAITKNFQSAGASKSGNSADVRNKLGALLTEFGLPVGDLDPKDIPYPWILGPAYFSDTIKSISDGSYADQPNNASARLSMLRPTAEQKLKSMNSSQSNQNATKNSNTQSTPSFNLDNANFAMRSLLDPYTATQVSISKAIALFESLYQKISLSMGKAKQQSQPNVAKNISVSNSPKPILNLKEVFDQSLDTLESHRPATDYVGFSTDLVTDVKTSRKFKTILRPPAQAGSTEFTSLSAHVNAGLLAVTSLDFELVMMDEEMMAEMPPSQTDGSEEEESTDLSERQKRRREKLLDRLREKKKESQRDRTGATAGPSENEAVLYLSPRLIDSRQNDGLTIEITSINENVEERQQYENMQNTVIATSAEISAVHRHPNDSTMQDRILGSLLGINVVPSKTPINVAIDLNLNQGKDTNFVTEATILGEIDSAKFETNALTNTECSDDSSLLLEMYKNQTFALPITQEFVNIMASNTTLDRVTERVDGNPRLVNKTFPSRTDAPNSKNKNKKIKAMMKKIKEDPRSVPPQIRRYMGALKDRESSSEQRENTSPRDRFRFGMLAKVTIFMGYENGDIRKPIWKSPKNWSTVLTDLRNDRTPHDFILCKVERQADEELISARGLEMTQTNMYFLITKNKSSLEIMGPQTDTPPARRRQRNRRTDEDPRVQSSVAVAVAPSGQRR